MIDNLKTLIKIARFELDEKRRELVNLQNKKQNILNNITEIDSQMEFEIKNSESNGDAKILLPFYIENMKSKQKYLLESANKLNPDIDKMTIKISEKFNEVKKFEIVLEQKLEELEYEASKKSQLELDEIAILLHERKNLNPN